MAEKFWNCYVEGTSGGLHFKHGDFMSAKIEAQRLARLPANRGRPVYLMECLGYCEVPESPVEWHEV